MGKRVALMVVVLGTVLGAAACDGPYIPAGWKPPVVTSVAVSPTPVVAGAPFDVTVSATDDKVVKSISIVLLGVHPERWNTMSVPCQGAAPFVPGPAVTKVFNCLMPAVAPNGTWTMGVTVCDGEVQCQSYGGLGGGGYATHTFEVTGGTDDDDAPVVESAVYDPDPVVAGSPFTLTIRFSDEHLVANEPQVIGTFSGMFKGGKTKYCYESARTQVSPTEVEFVLDCQAAPEAGQYRVNVATRDQIGNFTLYEPAIDIVAAP